MQQHGYLYTTNDIEKDYANIKVPLKLVFYMSLVDLYIYIYIAGFVQAFARTVIPGV